MSLKHFTHSSLYEQIKKDGELKPGSWHIPKHDGFLCDNPKIQPVGFRFVGENENNPTNTTVYPLHNNDHCWLSKETMSVGVSITVENFLKMHWGEYEVYLLSRAEGSKIDQYTFLFVRPGDDCQLGVWHAMNNWNEKHWDEPYKHCLKLEFKKDNGSYYTYDGHRRAKRRRCNEYDEILDLDHGGTFVCRGVKKNLDTGNILRVPLEYFKFNASKFAIEWCTCSSSPSPYKERIINYAIVPDVNNSCQRAIPLFAKKEESEEGADNNSRGEQLYTEVWTHRIGLA